MKKIVAIDFDGTLADSFGLINKAIIGACELFGVHLKASDLNEYWGPSEEGIFVNILGEENGPMAFAKYLEIYEECHDDYLFITPNIIKILDRLKKEKITMAYLTGRSEKSSLISLKKLGIDSYFDSYYYGSPAGINKEINLAKLCLDYSVNSDEVVYIGDSVADVISCKKADVDIFSVTFNHTYSYERLVKANPGNVCETVDELEKKLFRSISQ
jgi:phosphoglycolate phosphatase